MEVKEWSYEEIPAFSSEVEGAVWLNSTGDEIGVGYIPNVEYVNMGGVPLHLQILRPYTRNEPDKKLPCVVFVQGSAWFKQDVYAQIPMLARLAERGYVVAIVEYRHSEIAAFPAQIMDAKNAIRFMRVHANEYNIDPDNIVISGDSSGGHTAMYAGILHTDNDIETNMFPGVSAEPIGIVNYYGSTSVMSDDSNPIQVLHCLPDSPEGMVMGHVNLNENPELKMKLSVECNIDENTQVAPTIILHGSKDRLVNTEGSVKLYQKMKECGKDVKLYIIKGADHGGAEFWTRDIIDIVDGFIKSCIDKNSTR